MCQSRLSTSAADATQSQYATVTGDYQVGQRSEFPIMNIKTGELLSAAQTIMRGDTRILTNNTFVFRKRFDSYR